MGIPRSDSKAELPGCHLYVLLTPRIVLHDGSSFCEAEIKESEMAIYAIRANKTADW
jgi:hypothetical protein